MKQWDSFLVNMKFVYGIIWNIWNMMKSGDLTIKTYEFCSYNFITEVTSEQMVTQKFDMNNDAHHL